MIWITSLLFDRVKFRGKRCNDWWFPTRIRWITTATEQRNKDEIEFPGEHRRGKAIDRVDYHKIIHESEIELQRKSTHMVQENHVHTEPSASTHGSPPAPKEPCQQCGSKREPPIGGPNDPIEVK